jgi:hypothetical protein
VWLILVGWIFSCALTGWSYSPYTSRAIIDPTLRDERWPSALYHNSPAFATPRHNHPVSRLESVFEQRFNPKFDLLRAALAAATYKSSQSRLKVSPEGRDGRFVATARAAAYSAPFLV